MTEYIKEVGRLFNSGESNDSKNVSLNIDFEVNSVNQYINCIRRSVRKNMTYSITDIYNKQKAIGPFWIDSVDFSRLTPMNNGRMQFTQTLKLRFPQWGAEIINNPDLPPWCYPPFDYQCTTAQENINIASIYPPNSDIPISFTNTAGVKLDASGTKSIMQISFNYNVYSFDQNLVWVYSNTVNRSGIWVYDTYYEPRTLYMQHIDSKEITEYDETNTGEDSIKWRYTNISVQMLFKPESWNEYYLNVGTKCWSDNGLEDIYSWRNSGGSVQYGPKSKYEEASKNGATIGEAITEPMFLNNEGTGIAPFGGRFMHYDAPTATWKIIKGTPYQQQETYVSGCPFYPTSWDYLELPQSKDYR